MRTIASVLIALACVAAGDAATSFSAGASGPAGVAADDTAPVELGVRFRVLQPGRVTAIRFYRAIAIDSGYVATLWGGDGTALARAAIIEGQSPVPGWQRVTLFPAVAVAPGRDYVASYFASRGGYSYAHDAFRSPRALGALIAPADGDAGGNGVFRYGGGFPSESWRASDYGVDVEFTPDSAISPPRALTASAANATEIDLAWTGASIGGGEAGRPAAHQLLYRDGALIAMLPTGMSRWRDTLLAPESAHVYVVVGADAGAFSDASAPAGATTPTAPEGGYTGIWQDGDGPSLEAIIAAPTEVGIRFHSDVAGVVDALRYYKADVNTAPHRGHLWSADGTLIATTVEAPASGEFGFRALAFPTPVRIAAGVDYVISYTVPTGAYGWTGGYFSPLYASGVDAPPLHADRANSLTGPGGAFPTRIDGANPWVDVVFAADAAAAVSWWTDATVPDRPAVDDGAAVELGVRFRSDAGGTVRAIRFYRAAPSPAGYRATLWDDDGTALATVELPADDGVAGWRRAELATPIAVDAGRIYTASYLAPSGGYAFAEGFFGDHAAVAGPLVAPASSDVGGNGVFRYGGGFPTDSYRDSSYWVDVELVAPLMAPPLGDG